MTSVNVLDATRALCIQDIPLGTGVKSLAELESNECLSLQAIPSALPCCGSPVLAGND